MSISEQIKIEIKINFLRLELIKIIAEINRGLAANPKSIKTEEYEELKKQYTLKKEELHFLRVAHKNLSNRAQAA